MFGKDKIKNAVHCSDLPEDGLIEVRTHIFWFSELMGTNEKGARSNGLTTYICLDFFFYYFRCSTFSRCWIIEWTITVFSTVVNLYFVDTNVIYQVKRSMFTKLYLCYVQIVNASQPGECVHSKIKEILNKNWLFRMHDGANIAQWEQRCGNCDDVRFRISPLCVSIKRQHEFVIKICSTWLWKNMPSLTSNGDRLLNTRETYVS